MKKKIKPKSIKLTQDDKMLIILRDELYDGSWDLMIKDLKARMKKKPFVFKLYHRIQDDMKRIQRLHNFEKELKVNVLDCIKSK